MLMASLPVEPCPLSDLQSWCPAALMGNKGKVIAVDRDPVRFQRLKDNAKLTGATCIRCIQVRTHRAQNFSFLVVAQAASCL